MRPEFYSPSDVERSARLYSSVREWGLQRKDVTLIGGWAVYELVEDTARIQSRDLDLVLHDERALKAFEARFEEWGLAWRRSGRTVFKECRFRDAEPFPPIIDVFTSSLDIGAAFFTTQKATNVKPAKDQAFLPTLEYLLRDKLEVAPLRTDPDKSAKDLLDIALLLTRNRAGKTPGSLADLVREGDRRRIPALLRASAKQFPGYAAEFRTVSRWLRLGAEARQQQ